LVAASWSRRVEQLAVMMTAQAISAGNRRIEARMRDGFTWRTRQCLDGQWP